jgi:hypothetical protein
VNANASILSQESSASKSQNIREKSLPNLRESIFVTSFSLGGAILGIYCHLIGSTSLLGYCA